MRDVLGAWLSVLCMIHCFLPVILISLGVSVGLNHVAESMHHDWLHVVLLLPIVFILAISLPKAYRQHQHPLPSMLALIGVAILVIAVTLGTSIETPLTILGSIFVISSHLINKRKLKFVK